MGVRGSAYIQKGLHCFGTPQMKVGVGDTVDLPCHSGATVIAVTNTRVKVRYYCARSGEVEMWVDRTHVTAPCQERADKLVWDLYDRTNRDVRFMLDKQ